MRWVRIERVSGRDYKFPPGEKLFYYPPVTGERHSSNNKPEWYSNSMGGPRQPTHYMVVERPDN